MTESNPMSFKGWNIKTWAIKNKDSLKLIVSGVTGIVSTMLAGLTPTYSVALGTIVAAVSKMILDSLDYFQSE